jgi:hypothetical protein
VTVSTVNVGAQSVDNASPITATLPASTQAGDWLLIFCLQSSASGITFASSGYTSVGSNSNATRSMTLEVLAKKHSGTESNPSVTCSSPVAGWCVQMMAIRGANRTTFSDAAAVSSDAAAAATFQPTGITTATNGAMVISVVGSKDDNALNYNNQNSFSNRMSGANYDGSTGNGSDYSIGVAEIIKAVAGAQTCPTWNQSVNGNDAWVALTLAVKAAIDQLVTVPVTALVTTLPAPGVAVTVNNRITPPVTSLSTVKFAPQLKSSVVVPLKTLATTRYAPLVGSGVVVPVKTLTISTFAPTVTATSGPAPTFNWKRVRVTRRYGISGRNSRSVVSRSFVKLIPLPTSPVGGASSTVTPGVVNFTTTGYAPQLKSSVVVPVKNLTTATFAPKLQGSVVVPVKTLATLAFAPQLKSIVVVPVKNLTTSLFAPQLKLSVVPGLVSLTTSLFAPQLKSVIIVPLQTKTLTTFAPVLSASGNQSVSPDFISLTTTRFAPQLKSSIIIPLKTLATAKFAPVVGYGFVVPVKTLVTSSFTPKLLSVIIVPTKTTTLTGYLPVVSIGGNQLVVPSVANLTTTKYTPQLKSSIVVPLKTLATTNFAPSITASKLVTPDKVDLFITKYQPTLKQTLTVPTTNITSNRYPPILGSRYVPGVVNLSTSLFAPGVRTPNVSIPNTLALDLVKFAPVISFTSQNLITPQTVDLDLVSYAPSVQTQELFLDVKAYMAVSDSCAMGISGIHLQALTARMVMSVEEREEV